MRYLCHSLVGNRHSQFLFGMEVGSRHESFGHGLSSGQQSLTGDCTRRRGPADPAQSQMEARASSHALLLGEAPWNESTKVDYAEADPEHCISSVLSEQTENGLQVSPWPSWRSMTRTEKTNTAFVLVAVVAWAILYFPPIFHTSEPSDVVTACFSFKGFNYTAYVDNTPVQAKGIYHDVTISQAFQSATLCAVDHVSGHLNLLESISQYSAMNTKRWIESNHSNGLPSYSKISSLKPFEDGDVGSDVSIQVTLNTADISFAKNGSHVKSTVAAQSIYKSINTDRFTVAFLE